MIFAIPINAANHYLNHFNQLRSERNLKRQQVSGIKHLIQKGESSTLDFKQEISSSNKIAKTLVAFANGKGGTLLVGVRDDKTICGIESEEEKFMLQQAAAFFSKPEIEIKIKEHTFGKKTVLEITVPEGDQKPYYARDETGKWLVHIRVHDQTLLASKVVVDVLRREASGKGTLVKFTSKEEELLQYLRANKKITLKQFCRLINVSRWRAQKIMVNLVSAGVLRVHHTEMPEYYTLA
jgi:predicted HTH transcriptional regulator